MIALAAATAALGVSALLTAPAPAAVASHRMTPTVGVRPHAHRLGHPNPAGSTPFGCQLEVPACYGPDQIRAAYQIQPLLDHGITGEGRRIVIIDAFAPPGVAADLHTFDAIFGLADPTLTIIAPQGAVWIERPQPGRLVRRDRARRPVVAPSPRGRIVLVEARSNDDADILAATKYAVDHSLGDVISQSFGEDESCMVPSVRRAQERLFARATAKRITLIASSGDSGSAQPTCDGTSFSKAASTPASDPMCSGSAARPHRGRRERRLRVRDRVERGAELEAAGGGGFSVL
jgi:subtilase family serine protease